MTNQLSSLLGNEPISKGFIENQYFLGVNPETDLSTLITNNDKTSTCPNNDRSHMDKNPIRIIMVDDHKLVRDSWKILLENNPDFTVVSDCENGEQAIVDAGELLPDIMLVDINMSPMNGFAVTEAVAEKFPSIKIIGLSVNNIPNYAIRMINLGAKGYLTKTSSLDEIFEAIKLVHSGKRYVSREILANMKPEEMQIFE